MGDPQALQPLIQNSGKDNKPFDTLFMTPALALFFAASTVVFLVLSFIQFESPEVFLSVAISVVAFTSIFALIFVHEASPLLRHPLLSSFITASQLIWVSASALWILSLFQEDDIDLIGDSASSFHLTLVQVFLAVFVVMTIAAVGYYVYICLKVNRNPQMRTLDGSSTIIIRKLEAQVKGLQEELARKEEHSVMSSDADNLMVLQNERTRLSALYDNARRQSEEKQRQIDTLKIQVRSSNCLPCIPPS